MLVILSFILIAIVVISLLFIFNLNAAQNEKNLENPSQNKKEETIQQEVKPSMQTATPADILVQEKQQSRIAQANTTNISDQTYRQALQSFRTKDKNEADRGPKGKMNDDIFRKTLQSMSKKETDSNG
ncbi:hypothetical protein [Peribacillus asahii]|uniref:hypothetical protein n=1 Tax=Peribacillus asahii TaxID=228899 RepID=UPI00381FBEE8